MKHTLIPFCLSLMLTQASPSRKMNDREHEGFIGPVRKVFVERPPQTDGGNAPISARCPEETQIYDQQGRLISLLLYPGICGEDGEIRENYSYDKDGNRLGWHDNSSETYSDYEVNSRGDWIKRREIVEHLDQPNQAKTIRIISRTID